MCYINRHIRSTNQHRGLLTQNTQLDRHTIWSRQSGVRRLAGVERLVVIVPRCHCQKTSSVLQLISDVFCGVDDDDSLGELHAVPEPLEGGGWLSIFCNAREVQRLLIVRHLHNRSVSVALYFGHPRWY